MRNIASTELKDENVVINLSELNLEIHGSEMKWLGDFKQSYVVEWLGGLKQSYVVE